jgi:hypothetical protein
VGCRWAGPGKVLYVQNLMEDMGKDLCGLLENPATHVCICGGQGRCRTPRWARPRCQPAEWLVFFTRTRLFNLAKGENFGRGGNVPQTVWMAGQISAGSQRTPGVRWLAGFLSGRRDPSFPGGGGSWLCDPDGQGPGKG